MEININISVINDIYIKLFIGIITVLKTLSGHQNPKDCYAI